MLDIAPVHAAVILCMGDEADLDALPVNAATRCPIAPDEVLCLAPLAERADLLAVASAHLSAADAPGLAVDQTDGWSVWKVSGTGHEQVLTRLAAFEPPRSRPAFFQGVVGQVAVKAFLEESAMYLLVRSPVGHYLSNRILEACRDLGSRRVEPVEFAPEPAGVASGASGAPAAEAAR